MFKEELETLIHYLERQADLHGDCPRSNSPDWGQSRAYRNAANWITEVCKGKSCRDLGLEPEPFVKGSLAELEALAHRAGFRAVTGFDASIGFYAELYRDEQLLVFKHGNSKQEALGLALGKVATQVQKGEQHVSQSHQD